MFLIGGAAYSGTTLLAHLLNQKEVICLDEPDLHNPKQKHRAIPFLQTLFPTASFPPIPEKELTYAEAVNLLSKCQQCIAPYRLGMKTCNSFFVNYAKVYKEKHFPVIAIIRDIRDASIREDPPWTDEEHMNRYFRLIWDNLDLFDLWFRYEELVEDPEAVMKRISKVLSYDFKLKYNWSPESVHATMFKSDKHELLRSRVISKERVGIWKSSGKKFSTATLETARMMGY
jgi:hypothetical protein